MCGSRRRGVRLAVSGEIAAPVAVGPWRPSIVIPAALFDSLDGAELQQVGLHEAAHLARYDDWALLAQRVVEAVFVPHPVVWWVARRIELEREIACDDMVLAATGRPRDYASCLLRVVELCGGAESTLAGAAVGGRKSHLARRVENLLERRRHTGTRLLRSRLVCTAAALALLVWTAGRMPAAVAFAQTASAAVRQAIRGIAPPLAAAPAPQAAATAGFDAQVLEDASGNPLPSAELRFHKSGQIEMAADLDTDGNGRAHAPLPAGEYLLEIVKPNFIPARMKVTAPVSGMMLRLVRYGVISGQVLDQQGQPEPGIIRAPYGRTIGGTRIAILTQNPSGEFQRSQEATLEEDGKYRVYDLRPGQYAVAVAYDGLKDGSGFQMYPDNAHPRMFAVTGGEEYNDVNFTIVPRAVFDVSGKVELPAGQKQYALSLALPEQPLFPIAQTWTEDSGSGAFRFTKVPAGNYELFVGGPANGYGAHDTVLGQNPRFARLNVNVGQNVEGLDIAVSPGRKMKVTLRGHASDTLPEQCAKSTGVLLEFLEPWGLLLMNRAQVTSGKEETIGDLAPARYRVTAFGLGKGCYQVNDGLVDLTSGDTGSVALEVAPAGRLEGTLPGANLAVVLLSAAGGQTQVAFPDADGHFAFDDLAPGKYRVGARPASAAKTRWVADVSKMTEVEIAGGGTVHVGLGVKR